MALPPISFTNLLVNRRTHHKLIGHCNKHATWEQGPVQKSLIIDQDFFFFMNSPPGALCRYLCLCRAQSLSGDSSPWGPTINERAACLCCNGPFRIQPSQLPGQSTACLFVCACSLFSLLFYPFLFLPVALCKDFPPPLIPLPVCCMSDRSVCVSSLNGPVVWQLR